MQDGDLGEDIEQEAEIVESYESHRTKFQNDDAHLDPSRWWFASSAFPMIAGTLGPVASAFSICALVRPWRQHLAPGDTIDQAVFIKDEPWLTIVNAIQLVVAIISNLYLLLNMAKRVRFAIAQPITIVGWYISSICLLALNATAAGPLLEKVDYPHSEIIWSQAFYYGMYAAILYFVDASLMVVTFWGASANHYGKDFELTASQRTLMLQTIMFLVYLLVGALVFSNIEGWNYLDAIYWADVTLFTVGFGDYTCSTVLGRALMMPYALIGVISLGLVIGSIRSLVLERGRRRMAARLEEKKRRRVVRSMTRKGNDEILEPIREGSVLTRAESDKLPATEYERRKAEFTLMRRIQSQSSSRRRWMAMAVSTGSWLILWLVGAIIFEKSENPYQHWSYFDSFYFCFEALTTIGYGDVTPISNAGKSFFVFWSLLALPTMTVLISNAGDTVVKVIRDSTIRLGNLTILPGEEDFVGSFKHIVSRITDGKMFPNHRETAAPGIVVDKSKQTDERQDDVLTDSDNESHESIQDVNRGRPTNTAVDQTVHISRPQGSRASSTFTSRVRRDLSKLRNPYDDLPIGTDFHFLLISEIQVIATHLKDSKPRRYTYEQWAWYLKLIGEDERSAETHRKAKPKERLEDEEAQWSWVGNRSPLMGSQEESEWILERLVDRLRESLSAEGRKHLRGGEREAYRAHREAHKELHREAHEMAHEEEREKKKHHRENGHHGKKKQG